MSETPPTARELLTLLGMEDTVETLADRVEAVLALHERQRMMTVGCVRCNECGQDWPCATVLALNGGEP